ncbi:hypothetical protein SD80_012440 [Scytonema tolypothrichoides VB-61278]|nr:hypothetical protein SD80_012440 [Scytonema tolypothrichoides VB-61278]
MAQAAYYRLETKNVKRSEGHSSVAAAAYNTAEKLYDERTGITHDYRNKQHVYGNEILAPANAPAWVFDRNRLWNECEKAEDTSTRPKDARPARQLILSFPAFLSHDEKVSVSRSFLQRECVAKGMVVDMAYHDFEGEKSHNPHAHVLLTTRLLDGDRFGNKERKWNAKQQLQEWREKWAEYLNRHLEQNGYQQRVDHRSYEAQGIDRIPQLHEGRSVTALRDKHETKVKAPTIILNDKIAEINALKEEIRLELEELAGEQALGHKKAAEQDNRKPTLEEMEQTAKLAAELRQQVQRDFTEVTQEVIQGVVANAPPSPVTHTNQTDATKEKSRSESKAVPVDKQQEALRQDRARRDRTYYAVMRQLDAMGGDGRFEIGIGNDERGYFKEKTWHKDQILRIDPETQKAPILDYLKGENARGSHIYVRPAPHNNGDSQGLILIDDLDPVMAEDLVAKGLQPSVVVETSYRNCQAWVNISDRIDREEATQLAKLLAKEAGGDPGSASYQHYGRLAGFTNRKETHLDVYSGKYPWVLLHQAQRQSAAQAEHFLALAKQAVAKEKAEREEALKHRADLLKETATEAELRQAVTVFTRISTSVERKHGLKDPSRRDWVVLKRMAKNGYSMEALEHALRNSPDLATRKKGHEEDYIRRTIDKISRDPDLLQHLHRKQQKAQQRQQTPSEKLPQQDERQLIEQWRQYKDRERGKPASPDRERGTVRPSGETPKPKPSPGSGNTIRLNRYTVEEVPVYALGQMDADTVRYIVTRTLQSKDAEKQVNKALWALGEDTATWRDKCKGEYLKELGRIIGSRKSDALTPHTDAELAVKLKLAGFTNNQIAKTLTNESPFMKALGDEPSRQAYLAKGIAPVLQHPNTYRKIEEFRQTRHLQAMQLPLEQREAHLKEYRFDKLNIATKDGHHQQTTNVRQPQERKPETERER